MPSLGVSSRVFDNLAADMGLDAVVTQSHGW